VIILRKEDIVQMSEMNTKVKTILIKELDLSTSADQIGDREALYSPQVRLDSLGLLRVIMALEAEFGVEIDDEDLMEKRLETVSDLVELVATKRMGNTGEHP
jgi:acyl carrier protein